jgi:hypothetical protein
MQLPRMSSCFLYGVVLAFAILFIHSRTISVARPVSTGRSHAPIKVLRDAGGNPMRQTAGLTRGLEHAQLTSTNWSGYALPRFETRKIYTAAQATWTVPSVVFLDAPAGASVEYSSSWLGIGGYCKNKKCRVVDQRLIQLGTEQDARLGGDTQYYAWYEMLPAGSIVISSLVVNPGDVITASLVCAKRCAGRQSWTLSMTDETSGQSWSTVVKYQASKLSAEWIEEAPWYGGVLALADFGTANFSASTTNGTTANLSKGDSIVMVNSAGETSNVSAPSATLDGFNACWGSNNGLTPCVAP